MPLASERTSRTRGTLTWSDGFAPAALDTVAGVMFAWVPLRGTLASRDLELLSPREMQRALRFHGAHAFARYTALRVAARYAVSHYADCSPDTVRIGQDRCPRCSSPDHGPPVVRGAGEGITLSLSRSGEIGVVAVATGAAIGVDVEQQGLADSAKLVRHVTTWREEQYVNAQPGAARERAFLRCWTRKEAVGKASGVGIVFDLARLHVHPDATGESVVRACDDVGGTYRVFDVAAPAGYLAAAAVRVWPDSSIDAESEEHWQRR